MGLAPTTSTTLMLVLGDALAVALMERKGFSADQYRNFHPGGSLGRMLIRVSDLMRTRGSAAGRRSKRRWREVLATLSKGTLGCVVVVDGKPAAAAGIITHGDVGRHIGPDFLERTAHQVMTPAPKSARPDQLAAEALGADEREEDHPASGARSGRCRAGRRWASCTSTIACARGCNRWPNADQGKARSPSPGPGTRRAAARLVGARAVAGRRSAALHPFCHDHEAGAAAGGAGADRGRDRLFAAAARTEPCRDDVRAYGQGRQRPGHDQAAAARHRFLGQSLCRDRRQGGAGPVRTLIARVSPMCRPISRSRTAPGSRPARNRACSTRMPAC